VVLLASDMFLVKLCLTVEKKSHKQRLHENYNQKLLCRYKMNLRDVALSVEHTASPGMCALEEAGMEAVLLLHRENSYKQKDAWKLQ